ncbi:MAG: hypothetical protein B7733_13275 [Myxococcales bacterium FL481]|nr:MAG: hypothetical protein B7733_13275 [Myxococcales bacterium FL481]
MGIERARQARSSGRRAGWALIVAIVAIVAAAGSGAPVRADDTFATSLFSGDPRALWPLDIELELVRLSATPEGPDRPESNSLTRSVTRAQAGERTKFAHVEVTPFGKRTLTLTVVGRHHPGGRIELEYDLRVLEARYARIDLRRYVMHRLGLGAQLVVGPSVLRVSRADIVTVDQGVHREPFEIDGDRYEIRLGAASTRG